MRNKAISIMWLKSYLKLSADHLLWALVANVLIAENISKSKENLDDRIEVLPFLQSWKTKVESWGRTSLDISSLFKVAKEFNIRPDSLAFSRDIMRKMLMWYHISANPNIRKLNR